MTKRGFGNQFRIHGPIGLHLWVSSKYASIPVHRHKTNSSFVPLLCTLLSPGVLTVYLPVAITGFVIYGDSTMDNVLRSLPGDSWLRLTAEGLITAHLLCAFVIAINPFSQEFEELLHVPHSECSRFAESPESGPESVCDTPATMSRSYRRKIWPLW